MGRDRVSVETVFYVSRHNSEQDTADDRAVDDFRAALGALLRDPAYTELGYDVDGCEGSYRAMDAAARGRVAALLAGALARVRRGDA